MTMTTEQRVAAFQATPEGQKLMNMDATLLAELDRLAAYYEMSVDMCLIYIMGLQAKRGGRDAIAAMAFEVNYAWSRYKMGGRGLAYRALKQTYMETSAADVPA